MTKKKSKIKIESKNAGKFTEWCKRHGYNSVTLACIAAGLRSSDARVRRMANFAKNSRGWSKKR